MFKWKTEYETGVLMIDEQHKQLFAIGNRAYDLLRNEFVLDKYDKIMEIVDELKDYCAYHFNCEEKYMLSIGYKRFLSHKVQHEEFIAKFNNMDTALVDHDQDKYITDLLQFFLDWIDEHILQKDQDYVGQ